MAAGCAQTLKRRALCSGISGGQAKRVNIGIAVVVNPRVLFLDEPTSGLDSYTANEVMTVVKGLASENVTICATIHSPSPYTFELFDRLMVLVRGETVYFGANGQTMLDYFKSIEGTVRPPQTALDNNNIGNNADYLTDLVVGADREGRAHEYADAFEQSDLKRSMDAIVHRNAKVCTVDGVAGSHLPSCLPSFLIFALRSACGRIRELSCPRGCDVDGVLRERCGVTQWREVRLLACLGRCKRRARARRQTR